MYFNMEKFKIGTVDINFESIINKEIIQNCRDEAKEIVNESIKLSKEDTTFVLLLCELYVYHKENMGNIFCLHLDFLKSKLIEKDIMKDDGCFGKPF